MILTSQFQIRSFDSSAFGLTDGRSCSNHPAHDSVHEGDTSGLSARVVVDVHKFLAAAHMLSEDVMPDMHLLNGLKTIAGLSSSCSPRVNLMFRSSNELKTVGGRVCFFKNRMPVSLTMKRTGQLLTIVLCESFAFRFRSRLRNFWRGSDSVYRP